MAGTMKTARHVSLDVQTLLDWEARNRNTELSPFVNEILGRLNKGHVLTDWGEFPQMVCDDCGAKFGFVLCKGAGVAPCGHPLNKSRVFLIEPPQAQVP